MVAESVDLILDVLREVRPSMGPRPDGRGKDGKPFSFTKHSANTAEGLRIATLKDDFGVLLRDGATVEAVLAGEQKYGSYEILDLREVVEGGLTDVWPDTADLEI